ncbi:MAG: exodeoxyribonuclease VII small subunit [Clostridiales bacterium]|nr:exodeoxyribonuclease VII small subunit [Clostridiales bacterium]
MNKKAETTEHTFESAISRLEEIVRTMEGGDVPLDSSIALFEEGIALVKLCNSKLDHAEQRVKILVKGEDGTLTEEDFAGGTQK